MFFGGLWPTLALSVMSTQGTSKYADKREPSVELVVGVRIYHPCLPNMGYKDRVIRRDEDRTGPAKRITRVIRGLFLDAVFASSIGRDVQFINSQADSRDEIGQGVTDERREHILWIDQTELRVST